ncbi:hypothetical protein EV426DRAFT_639136 [Tirmania nivea]|nr:hypothetical protein EV426DRAFT_639136 [Tirmania nivea]
MEFLSTINSFRTQALKPSTIRTAFRKTGMIPYNPKIVLDRLPEAQQATRNETEIDSNLSDEFEPSTPPPILSGSPVTPATVRSLKRKSDQLLQYMEKNNLSPTFQRHMRVFTKGSIAQAHDGAQAVEDLHKTTAAQKARQAQQNASKRSLQKGGVLYASKARAMVKEKQALSEAQKILSTQRALTQLLKAEERKRERLRKALCKEIRKYGRERAKAEKEKAKTLRQLEEIERAEKEADRRVEIM